MEVLAAEERGEAAKLAVVPGTEVTMLVPVVGESEGACPVVVATKVVVAP